MQNKSGRVFEDLSYDSKKKGLALFIRDLEGLELEIKYLLNYKHFAINQMPKNVHHYNVYLYIKILGHVLRNKGF